MTADQHIAYAAARAAVAYRNGDDLLGDYWTERCTRLSDKRELDAINEARTRDAITRLERCPTFDELKGSPDHSGTRVADTDTVLAIAAENATRWADALDLLGRDHA